jgi:site-specific DNA recombinase
MKRDGRLSNKRVALYGRYSSENQRESSIQDQLHRARDFVGREGGDPRKTIDISDAAVSGTKNQRRGLQALLALAEKREIDAIVVEDISRLARDTEHCAHYLKVFARCGVTLYGVADGIDTSDKNARMNVGLRALMAEEYVAALGDKTLRGLEGRARAGLLTGGRLYGFGSEPVPDGRGGFAGAKPIVRPEEAAVVERIFRSYAEGLSLAGIANELNRDKVASPRANPKPGSNPKYFRRGWSASTVRDMLRNSAYIGQRKFKRLKWTRTNELGLGREGRTSHLRDPSEVIAIEGPRIIDDVLWTTVQARLAAVRAYYTRNKGGELKARVARPGGATTHLLSGVMKCVCGASMVLVGGSSKKYYGCNDNKKRGSHICPNRMTVSEEVSRQAILEELRERMLSERAIVFLRECIAKELASQSRNFRGERDEREQALSRTQARIAGLVEFIANGDTSNAVRTALKDLEAQAREERAKLKELEASSVRPVRLPTPDEILEQARRLEQTLMTDPTCGREMLLQFFEHGRLTLEPQPAGHYVARSRWLPTRALTVNTRTPQSGGPGRFVDRATALSCAGRI